MVRHECQIFARHRIIPACSVYSFRGLNSGDLEASHVASFRLTALSILTVFFIDCSGCPLLPLSLSVPTLSTLIQFKGSVKHTRIVGHLTKLNVI